MTLHNMAVIDLGERQFDKARAKLTQAIEWQRKALATNPNHPPYRKFLASQLDNLIKANQGMGRADEAAEAQRELDELRNSNPQIVALDARLSAVLKGQAPKDEAERLQLAYRAYDTALYALSARLFAEAFANNAKLADDRQARHRYNAACAAALAAAGKGKDDLPPDDAARVKLRNQAREWLTAELRAWTTIVENGSAEQQGQRSRPRSSIGKPTPTSPASATRRSWPSSPRPSGRNGRRSGMRWMRCSREP